MYDIYMHNSLFVELSTLMNPMLCGPPRVTLFRDYYVGPHSSIYTIIVISPTWCRRAVWYTHVLYSILRGTLPCRLVFETWEHIVLWVLRQIDFFWISEFSNLLRLSIQKMKNKNLQLILALVSCGVCVYIYIYNIIRISLWYLFTFLLGKKIMVINVNFMCKNLYETHFLIDSSCQNSK